MKHFIDNHGEYWGFTDSQITEGLSDQMRELSELEFDKLKNPQNYLNDEEKEQWRLAQFKSLTRRQFKLALLENGLLSTVEQMIESIEDPTVKARIQIEYSESERFERTNQSVQYMLGVLDLTSDQVDEMWHYAMTL